ncbi:flagellar hook protein FlgE [Gammaproteobacteria bacterium]
MPMSFNTALSGLSASSTDLSVIGNNIANANTIGFKFSRTEFADLYSASLRTYSGARMGTGVKVADVVQQFSQGNSNTTEQSLDLSISGDGFFRVTDVANQGPSYTRNGAFHLNNNNDIVNTNGQYLSVYQSDPKTGQILGTISKLNVDQSDIPPASTTGMNATLNLNSSEIAPTATNTITASGLRLSNADTVPTATFDPKSPSSYNMKTSTTIYDASGIAHPASLYFIRTADNNWDMHATVDGVNGFNGSVEVFTPPTGTPPATAPVKLTFDPNTGTVTTITPPKLIFNTFKPGTPGFIIPDANNPFEFSLNGLDTSIQSGGINWKTTTTPDYTPLGSTAAILSTATMPTGTFDPTVATTYDFHAPEFSIKDSSGATHYINQYFVSDSPGSYSWSLHTFVSDTSGVPGVEVFYDPNYPSPVKVTANADGTLNTRPSQFEYAFDPSNTSSTPPNPNRSDILKFSFNGLQSYPDAAPKLVADGNSAKVWTSPKEGNLPDPTTYNYTTSTTIYDSQGGSHLAAFYFVKVGSNAWDMHAFVDNNELNTSGTGSQNGTGSPVRLTFDSNGSLVSKASAPPPPTYDQDGNLIANRTQSVPINGAIPLTAAMNNGTSEINFKLDLDSMTQYGSPSGVSSLSQDGYATGHISSINVEADGKISSLYTNGKSRVLGQAVMVTFANIQGLRPIGNTSWGETPDSGEPLLVHAGEAGSGMIQSGALESSNVDLTKQLVDMIVAQRTFQANAQVVSAVDNLTQTIVNLR